MFALAIGPFDLLLLLLIAVGGTGLLLIVRK